MFQSKVGKVSHRAFTNVLIYNCIRYKGYTNKQVLLIQKHPITNKNIKL